LEKTVPKIIPLSEESLQRHPRSKQQSLPKAESIHLIQMVSYEDNAIVSRTLINGKYGTITIFAFDQGQGLSEHTSPFDAFVQVLEGSAEITVSGKGFQATEGEVVILPAKEPHSLAALSKFKMLLTMIRSE
jgi:quercetin dioxygenase-like cupin family protein